MDTALSNYETIAPVWPDCLKYTATGGWRFYVARVNTISRSDRSGQDCRWCGAKAIAAAIERLARICPDDAPMLIEARQCLDVAKSIEEQENEAGELSGFDGFERDFDARVKVVGEIEEVILSMEAKTPEDLRLQARVLRDSDAGRSKDSMVLKFLNSVMTASFAV